MAMSFIENSADQRECPCTVRGETAVLCVDGAHPAELARQTENDAVHIRREPMRISLRLLAATTLVLGAPAALASNPNGLLTLVVGLPLLLAASVVLGILLVLRSRPPVKVMAIVLFTPTLFYSLYVALDALTLLGDIGSENSMIGLAFFGLLALACLLFFLIVRRRPVVGG